MRTIRLLIILIPCKGSVANLKYDLHLQAVVNSCVGDLSFEYFWFKLHKLLLFSCSVIKVQTIYSIKPNGDALIPIWHSKSWHMQCSPSGNVDARLHLVIGYTGRTAVLYKHFIPIWFVVFLKSLIMIKMGFSFDVMKNGETSLTH